MYLEAHSLGNAAGFDKGILCPVENFLERLINADSCLLYLEIFIIQISIFCQTEDVYYVII